MGSVLNNSTFVQSQNQNAVATAGSSAAAAGSSGAGSVTYQVGGVIGLRNFNQFGLGDSFGKGTINQPGQTGGAPFPGRLVPASDWGGTPPSNSSTSGDSQQGSEGKDNGESKGEPEKTDRDHTDRAEGKDKKNKDLTKAKGSTKRPKQKNANHSSKHLGVKDLDKEGGSSGCSGDNNDPGSLPDDIIPGLGGLARNLQTQMPAMEQLLSNIPNAILGNFLGGMPPAFQSFIPPGVISGLGNNGAFSLNGLIGLIGGAAIGNMSNDIIRSLLPNIGIPIQALGQLSSMPLNQLITLPANQLASSLNIPNLSGAALAQVISTVQLAVGTARNGGIPLNSQLLNQAVYTALSSTNLGQIIPTNIVGLASSLVQNPLGTIVNAAMGSTGNLPIPIIPSNLSNPSAALLTGLNQFVPPEIAQTLMNPQQLMNMLPMNLQNLIPAVAPLLQGAAPNFIQQVANASPIKMPGSDQAGGNQGTGAACKIKQAPNDGKDSKDMRDINYSQMLSESFDLFQLSAGSAMNPGGNRIHKGSSGPDVDEIIKSLSGMAVNVLEPLREAFPNMQINSGYRESGDHAKGKTVDVAFPVSPKILQEIADWARQYLPVTVELNQHKTGWLHLKYNESCSGAGAASTSSSAGCEKGLVNRKG